MVCCWLLRGSGIGALALLLTSAPLIAGNVYKCTNAAGKFHFSDLPCARDHHSARLHTVESVIGGNNDDVSEVDNEDARARADAESKIFPNQTVRINGNRRVSGRTTACAMARSEYTQAKQQLRCWASPTCESDHTRELFARVERTCQHDQSTLMDELSEHPSP